MMIRERGRSPEQESVSSEGEREGERGRGARAQSPAGGEASLRALRASLESCPLPSVLPGAERRGPGVCTVVCGVRCGVVCSGGVECGVVWCGLVCS